MVKIHRKVNDLGPSVFREATADVPYHDWASCQDKDLNIFSICSVGKGIGNEKP